MLRTPGSGPSAGPKSEMATIGQHGGRDPATNYFIVGITATHWEDGTAGTVDLRPYSCRFLENPL